MTFCCSDVKAVDEKEALEKFQAVEEKKIGDLHPTSQRIMIWINPHCAPQAKFAPKSPKIPIPYLHAVRSSLNPRSNFNSGALLGE